MEGEKTAPRVSERTAPEQRAVKGLLLTSSNASRTYLTDVFSILALPRDWVFHYRYRVEWLDDRLKNLPTRTAPSPGSPLRGTKVLIAYVYQRVTDPARPRLTPTSCYPLRYGVLRDAYRLGRNDTVDIAHFYFALGGYVNHESDSLRALGERMVSKHGTHGVYAVHENFPVWESSEAQDENAAIALVRRIPPDDLKSEPLSKSETSRGYYPVPCLIRSLKRTGGPVTSYRRRRFALIPLTIGPLGVDGGSGPVGEPVRPKFDWRLRRSYFELSEKSEYAFDFSFYIPDSWGVPMGNSHMRLTADREAFSSPPENTLKVGSRYDDHAWLVVPSSTAQERLRTMTFATSLKPAGVSAGDVLNLELPLAVRIRPRTFRRASHLIASWGAGVFVSIATVAFTLAFAQEDIFSSFDVGRAELVAAGLIGYVGSFILKLITDATKS